jgi:hypothetical protein
MTTTSGFISASIHPLNGAANISPEKESAGVISGAS